MPTKFEQPRFTPTTIDNTAPGEASPIAKFVSRYDHSFGKCGGWRKACPFCLSERVDEIEARQEAAQRAHDQRSFAESFLADRSR